MAKDDKTVSNAILSESEMIEWYSDETNHYLLEKKENVVECYPFVCDFEVVDDSGTIKLRGVRGQGLGFNLDTKQLIIIGKD